jgi:phage terminase large subunit-like protein
MASNVCVSRRIDKSLVTKKDTPMSANKIDGIDATIEALHPLLIEAPREPQYQVLIVGGR